MLLFLALLGDTLFGGVFYRFHPVLLMGSISRTLERWFFAWTSSLVGLRILGILLVLTVSGLFMTGSATLLFLLGINGYHALSDLLTVFWGYQLLAGRSLEIHVRQVYKPLLAGEIASARAALSRIVGRDTGGLDQTGILRGAIESLSENANDALSAPLFFFALGGLPLLMGYKAVSTLDSQVGYKSPPYRDLGWASARLDDCLAFIPARLTLLVLLLLFGPAAARLREIPVVKVWEEAFRFRLAHPSPNSGHSISGFAALLGVRVGGGAFYGGTWSAKPWIGEGREHLTTADLENALRLYRRFRWAVLGGVGVVSLLGMAWSSWKGI
ncbi:MAG: adenosylcobinamide-phosphate synthase CbiB [Leptospirales bacterium]